MKSNYRFSLSLIIILFCTIANGQTNPFADQIDLDKLGLTQDEMLLMLKSKGIDIKKLDPNNPNDIKLLEAALAEGSEGLPDQKSPDQFTARQDSGTVVSNPSLQKVVEVKDKLTDTMPSKQDRNIKNRDFMEDASLDIYEKLPPSNIYGHHIFRNKEIAVYRQSKDIKPPQSYILGAGDVLGLSIWGNSQLNAIYDINEDGYIKPSNMGRIYLKGLSLSKARQLVMDRFGQYYSFRPEEFELTLSVSRTITIGIYGEAIKPGSYTLPAINTVFNALMAAGGPTDLGTVRTIQLHRSGYPPKTIDIYAYLLNPSESDKFFLENGDIIYIPVRNKEVTIYGAINRPYTYELLNNEQLTSLIRYAGGLKPEAYTTSIQLRRIENEKEKIIDVPLRTLIEQKGDFPLMDHDIISIQVSTQKYENYIDISGPIYYPGRYELQSNLHLRDVLIKSKMKEDCRLDIGYIFRYADDGTVSSIKFNPDAILKDSKHIDNYLLNKKDLILLFSKSTFVSKYSISINGAVRSPTKVPYDPKRSFKLDDLVVMAGGLVDDAADFGYVRRLDPTDATKAQYIRINIRVAINDPKGKENMLLAPEDQVLTFSNSAFNDRLKIDVIGLVKSGGQFTWHPGMTLRDALTLSGGIQFEADPEKVDIFRLFFNTSNPVQTKTVSLAIDKKSITDSNPEFGNNVLLEPFDIINVRMKSGFSYQRIVEIKGEVKYPGFYALEQNNQRITDLIAKAGGLTPEAFIEGATFYRSTKNIGNVVINLNKAIKNTRGSDNVILMENDILHIPRAQHLVLFRGEINPVNPAFFDDTTSIKKFAVAFQGEKSARFYINNYTAGLSKKGSLDEVTVIYPNGQKMKTKKFLFFNNTPTVKKGSLILVGEKDPDVLVDGSPNPRKTNWNKLLSDAFAQASAVLTLFVLYKTATK